MTITQADLDAARDDILAKTNERFSALAKLVPPAPVPAPKIRFAAHRYQTDGPVPTADFYDVQRYVGSTDRCSRVRCTRT